MSVLTVISPIVALAVIAVPASQDKPNFSGRWVLTSPAAAAGQEQTVTQTAETLTTAHASAGHGHRTVYRLDGTESRNAIVSHGLDIVTTSTAAWTGNALTITSHTTYPDKRTLATKAVWSLDAQGRRVVDLTETWNAGTPETTRLVYIKR